MIALSIHVSRFRVLQTVFQTNQPVNHLNSVDAPKLFLAQVGECHVCCSPGWPSAASQHPPALGEFCQQHLTALQVWRKRTEHCKYDFPKQVISSSDNLICPYLKFWDYGSTLAACNIYISAISLKSEAIFLFPIKLLFYTYSHYKTVHLNIFP